MSMISGRIVEQGRQVYSVEEGVEAEEELQVQVQVQVVREQVVRVRVQVQDYTKEEHMQAYPVS